MNYICNNCKYSYVSKGMLKCESSNLCIDNSLFKMKEELFEYKPILEEKEMVDHPSHYNQGKFEAIDVIEDWKLNFNLGNTVKYISRAGHKDNIIQDLKKASWYLNREIERLEKVK